MHGFGDILPGGGRLRLRRAGSGRLVRLMYAWLLWCGIAGSLLLLLYYLGHTLRWVRLMREGNVSRMLDDVRVVSQPGV